MQDAPWILLNPGPVNLSLEVREALLGPDLCHREPEFVTLMDEVRERLPVLLGAAESHLAVLVAGSGTSAVEAMIRALPGPGGGKLAVLVNGVYGDRMAEMARRAGVEVLRVESRYLDPVDLSALEALLRREQGVRAVAVVHHETTTGRLNPIAEVGALARAHGVRLLVDSVSGLGAEPIELAGVDLCAGTANKALHGVPGVSFVLVRREVIRELAGEACGSVYLDLAAHLDAQERGEVAFTMPVHVLAAFRAALTALAREGLEARHERFAARAREVRAALERLELRLLLPPEARSASLTTAHLPEGLDYRTLHDGLKAGGFVIYAGQGSLAGSVFRVAHLGEYPPSTTKRFLESLARLVQRARRTRRVSA